MKLIKYYTTGVFTSMMFFNAWAQDGQAEVKIQNDSIFSYQLKQHDSVFSYHMKNMGIERYKKKDPGCHVMESQRIENCQGQVHSKYSTMENKSQGVRQKEDKKDLEKNAKRNAVEKKSAAGQTINNGEGNIMKQNN